jgi:hypothetical protein
VLPEPLAELILQVVATRRGKAVIGDQGSSPWLFPGGQPGRPISAFGLAEQLRQPVGIGPRTPSVETLGRPAAPARIKSKHRSTNVIFNGSRSDPPPVLRIQA